MNVFHRVIAAGLLMALSLPSPAYALRGEQVEDPSRRTGLEEALQGSVTARPAAEPLIIHELNGHTANVLAAAFTADGRQLATAGEDPYIRVWDTAHGTLLRALDAHHQWVRSLAFNAAGTLLASGDDEGVIRVWNLQRGTFRQVTEAHKGTVWWMAFSPDGRFLASVSDEQVIVWDLQTGQRTHEFSVGGGHLNGGRAYTQRVAFDAEGRLLIASVRRNALRLAIWTPRRVGGAGPRAIPRC